MSKLYTKSVLTVLTLAVIIGLVPTAFGATKVIIAGSSALFNTVALGAYNNGSGPTGAVAPTFHWSFSNANLVLQDTRVTPNNNDAAKVWVVWDSSTAVGGPNVWIYANVDSVVGQPLLLRCSGLQTGRHLWNAMRNGPQPLRSWFLPPSGVLTHLPFPATF